MWVPGQYAGKPVLQGPWLSPLSILLAAFRLIGEERGDFQRVEDFCTAAGVSRRRRMFRACLMAR